MYLLLKEKCFTINIPSLEIIESLQYEIIIKQLFFEEFLISVDGS